MPGPHGKASQDLEGPQAPGPVDTQPPRPRTGETSTGQPRERVEPKTADIDNLGQGPAGQLPPQDEPARGDSDLDTSSWHQAFERLAARRGQGQPAEPNEGAPAQRAEGAPEHQAAGRTADSPPRTSQQGAMETPPQMDSPHPPATAPAPPSPARQPPSPGAETSESVQRHDDFAALRRQVAGDGIAETPGAAGAHPPDSVPPVQGTTRTGPPVQDTTVGGMPPGAGEGTVRPAGVARASSATFPAGVEDAGRPPRAATRRSHYHLPGQFPGQVASPPPAMGSQTD